MFGTNLIMYGESEIHANQCQRDKDGDRQNIKNILHRDGSCCGGAIGLFDHKSGVGGDGKGH